MSMHGQRKPLSRKALKCSVDWLYRHFDLVPGSPLIHEDYTTQNSQLIINIDTHSKSQGTCSCKKSISYFISEKGCEQRSLTYNVRLPHIGVIMYHIVYCNFPLLIFIYRKGKQSSLYCGILSSET